MFTVTFDGRDVFAVKSTAVSGNVVVLTLVDAPQTITAATKITVATADNYTADDGVTYTLTSTNGMTFDHDIVICASNNNDPSES